MDSDIILHAKSGTIVLKESTKNILVSEKSLGVAEVCKKTNGTLTIMSNSGIPGDVIKLLEEHNLDNHAHPNLWYVFEQGVSTDLWIVQHDLNRHPSVTIVDSGDNVVVGAVTYIDNNNLEIKFNGAFKGKAYLN